MLNLVLRLFKSIYDTAHVITESAQVILQMGHQADIDLVS